MIPDHSKQKFEDRITHPIHVHKVGECYFIGRALALKERKRSSLPIESVILYPKGDKNGRYNRY